MWKDKGFTQLPNLILNNPAIPGCIRATYEAIAARAFGKRSQVFASEAVLAKDRGISRRSISRHLKALEALHLVKRVRRGEQQSNIIVLPLKARLNEGGISMTEAIKSGLASLPSCVLNRTKLTLKDALALAVKPSGGKRKMSVREPERIVRCVCPECGVIRPDYVAIRHIESPQAWHKAGYLVILCGLCRNRVVPSAARKAVGVSRAAAIFCNAMSDEAWAAVDKELEAESVGKESKHNA